MSMNNCDQIRLGAIHKLRWQDFSFFDHLPPCVDIFYGINVDKKWTFLDHLPKEVRVRFSDMNLFTPTYLVL